MTIRSRIRDLGIRIGDGPTGTHNAITDVRGIRVGHTTIHDGPRLHTGVTAIVPDTLPIPAGLFVGNGYGKLIGSTQIDELGEIETPILLTSTLSTFRVADALVTWMLRQPDQAQTRSLSPVVGETNDGYLSDIRARAISEDDVFAALDGAVSGPVAEGGVGAGAGTVALGFKAGIGTASRVVKIGDGQREAMSRRMAARGALASRRVRPPLHQNDDAVTVGALVQANFAGTLVVQGRPIPAPVTDSEPDGNSCMIIVATDAPLDSRQLERIARRAVFAMGRVGASYSHGSGDYGIAISTREGERLRDRDLDPLFIATMDAVEEALLNSLAMAETTYGVDGHVREAVDFTTGL